MSRAYREAKPFLGITALVFLIALWLFPAGAFLAVVPFGYILYFFRDPKRIPPRDPRTIVSAADGKVLSVVEIEESHFTHKSMKRIAVFLSVSDVHINRSPVAGEVDRIHYQPGQFLDARDPKVAIKNEAQSWFLKTERGNVVVRQIAGLIARRIVAWKKEKDTLQKGEQIGMIRFGSRTDVYLPAECNVVVTKGDTVRGGETIIGFWPPNEATPPDR